MRVAFGSMANFKAVLLSSFASMPLSPSNSINCQIEKSRDQGYHFDYRRSMLGAWFGTFMINFGLFTFLSLLGTRSFSISSLSLFKMRIGVTSFIDAYLIALLASLVMAGSSALHDFWRGSSIGVVIFDQAFNAVAFPIAAVLILAIKPLL